MKIQDKKLFIFDLDGTLVDAYKAIADTLNYVRVQFGHEKVPFGTIKRNIGYGDKNFVACFFKKSELAYALAMYRKQHKQSLRKYAKLKPYSRLLLFRLKQRGKLLAIASNRPSQYTDIVLRALDVKKYFDYILCANQVKALKPDPKILHQVLKKIKIRKEDAVYAGDMDVDMETAKRARIDALFITGGSCTINEVRKYKHKRIVKSLKDILSFK